MYQLVYNEKESKSKKREVYILYKKDESTKEYKPVNNPFLFNPVKLEINRDSREFFMNNLRVKRISEKKEAREIFEFIRRMKDVLEIEMYLIMPITKSSDYYRKIYGDYI